MKQDDTKLFSVPLTHLTPLGRATIVMHVFGGHGMSCEWINNNYIKILKGIDDGSISTYGDVKRFIEESYK